MKKSALSVVKHSGGFTLSTFCRSPVGCTIGGLLVGVIEKLLEGQFSYEIADPAVYSLLLLMLLFRPTGLFAPRSAVRD